jgi:hypothetical protein
MRDMMRFKLQIRFSYPSWTGGLMTPWETIAEANTHKEVEQQFVMIRSVDSTSQIRVHDRELGHG